MAMATKTRTRKPPTDAQMDKALKAIDVRYAVSKMADRYAKASQDYMVEATRLDYDAERHERAFRRMGRCRRALERLLEASMTAYKAEVYR